MAPVRRQSYWKVSAERAAVSRQQSDQPELLLFPWQWYFWVPGMLGWAPACR